jgi:hypothetical protein
MSYMPVGSVISPQPIVHLYGDTPKYTRIETTVLKWIENHGRWLEIIFSYRRLVPLSPINQRPLTGSLPYQRGLTTHLPEESLLQGNSLLR